MNCSNQKKSLSPPLTIKAIRDGVKGIIPSVEPLTTPPLAIVLPLPRKAPAKAQASVPILSDGYWLAPGDGDAWALSSRGCRTFSLSSSNIDLTSLPLSEVAPAKPPRRLRRLRPAEEAFLARPLEVGPTLADRRGISFACPACHHSISLPLAQAGQKSRCPQCSSAIRAPQLRTLGKAHTYERSVESLLHPENFLAPHQPTRKLLGLPMPKVQQVLVGSAVAIIALCGLRMAWLTRKLVSTPSVAQIVTLATKLDGEVSDPVADAEKLVKDFLMSANWKAKARFVRDPMRVGKLMEHFYAGEMAGEGIAPLKVTASAPTYYYNTEQLKHRHSVVDVEMPNGLQHHFIVEFLPQGPKLEWESSVAYTPVPWREMLAVPTSDTQYLQRVSACLDDYYNHEFNDRSKYISLYLEDPNTGESLGNGYLLRDSDQAREVLNVLAKHSRQHLKHIMIEVQPQATAADHRIIQIKNFVKSGFRTPETAVATSR